MPEGCCWTNPCGGMSSRCDVIKNSIERVIRSDERKKSAMMDESEVGFQSIPLSIACGALRIVKVVDG